MANGHSGGRRIAYSNTVSLGNILSLAVMLGAALFAFSDLKGDVRVLNETVENNDTRLVRVENRLGLGVYGLPRSGPR